MVGAPTQPKKKLGWAPPTLHLCPGKDAWKEIYYKSYKEIRLSLVKELTEKERT